MTDISSPRLLYIKAVLFVLGGLIFAGLLLLESRFLCTATLLFPAAIRIQLVKIAECRNKMAY